MRIIIDIETVYEDWDIGGGPPARTMKKQALHKEYPDLDSLWVKYIELEYELRILEMNERHGELRNAVRIVQTLGEIQVIRQKAEKAREDYELLLKLLWDHNDGINL